MAPRFRRRRQASQTSSGAHTSNSRASQRARFKRSARHPHLPSQRGQPDHNHSQADVYHSIPQESTPRQSHSQQTDDAPIEESRDEVVMAIDRHQKQAIGAAYYIASEERMYCLQDIAHGDLDALETVKMEVQPTTILLSSRVDSDGSGNEAARLLRRSSLLGDGDEPPLSYEVDLRPSQEFAYEAAKTKLINLETTISSNHSTNFLIPGAVCTGEDEQDHENLGSTHRQGKFLRLSSWIDFENCVGVGCVGAILTHLQRKKAAQYLPDDPDAQNAFCVRSLEMVSLRNTMFINPDTLLSLQIIQPEAHPNAFNQGPGSSGAKESLSIYGLFHHHARTPQGKVRLRQIFLRPSVVLAEIQGRHDFVGIFARPDNLAALQKLSKSMSRIKNIRTVMTHLHKGINGGNQKFGGFKSGVWPTLLEFAYHTIDIRDTLREVHSGRQLPLIAKALELLDTRLLQTVGTNIHDVVDLDSSIEQNRTSVKRGVNDQLDNIKNIYDGMDELLSRTAVDIARTLPDHVASSLNVIYFPQLGYHITLPLDPLTRQPVYQGGSGLDVDRGGRWERMFTTENQVYFKDARMREMDEMLGDLWNMICDLEIEIGYDLAQRVLEYEEILVAISDMCGELDCMFSLAQGAIQHKLVRPRMTTENVIDIKDCRHLLQEMTIPSYVTNDAYLAGGNGSGYGAEPSQFQSQVSSPAPVTPTQHAESGSSAPSMFILTGPNYSGKSIYLKSIAHAVYLAHIGSFVPCSDSTCNTNSNDNHQRDRSAFGQPTIGLTDAILTRIRTCETVSRCHSAFMIDLQQVTQALRIATRRSLVIIDEFGKGTESADGAGLAAGLFTHLLNRGTESPKVVAATHFHEIFELGHLSSTRYPMLGFGHLEVRIDRQQTQDSRPQHSSDPTSSTSHPDVSITYLHTLRAGRSTNSFGTQCALLNGIPRPVVQRAALIADLVAKGEDLVGLCAGGMSAGEEEELRLAEEVGRRFLMWDLETEEEAAEGTGLDDVNRKLAAILDVVDRDGSNIDTDLGSRSMVELDVEVQTAREIDTQSQTCTETQSQTQTEVEDSSVTNGLGT